MQYLCLLIRSIGEELHWDPIIMQSISYNEPLSKVQSQNNAEQQINHPIC